MLWPWSRSSLVKARVLGQIIDDVKQQRANVARQRPAAKPEDLTAKPADSGGQRGGTHRKSRAKR